MQVRPPHLAPVGERLVAVQLAPECQPTRPCKDAGHGVGAGGLALLILTPVAGHSACMDDRMDCGSILRSWHARKGRM